MESVKLANVLIKTLMSQGMQNGLLSTQLQLPVDKTLLVAVITRLATLRKQHLLAMTAVQQLSHDITPSEEQQLTQTPGSQILGHHHTTHMMTLALMQPPGRSSAKGIVWYASRSQRLQYSKAAQPHSREGAGDTVCSLQHTQQQLAATDCATSRAATKPGTPMMSWRTSRPRTRPLCRLKQGLQECQV